MPLIFICMNHFTRLTDHPSAVQLIKQAVTIKRNPKINQSAHIHQSICLIFINPSLRTRLSTQQAAFNLGLNCAVFDVGAGGWKLEFENEVIMDSDKPEHIKEAAAVLGSYFDILAVRAFASLEDKIKDYSEPILNGFIKYSGVPVINLESATRHPLQSLADLITIHEHITVKRPKVVLSWAPHPKALPQAVANSFLEWASIMDYELVLTHPEGYELEDKFVGNTPVVYNQQEAFKDAHFIYAKNWSSVSHYGQVLSTDPSWTIDTSKMALTSNAYFMHCLPVRRNVVVTDAVIDSERSLVIKQAENRIYAAQAVLSSILADM